MVSGSILIRFSESITLPTGKDPIKLYHNGSQAAANVTLQEEDWVALLTFSAALVNGQDYTLTITIDLEDKHQNTLSEEFSQPFTYQGADVIVYDRVPPEVEKVELMSDVYHVTLTEEYDPATLPSSVDIFTSTKTYVGTVAAEGPKQFTFTTSQALDANTEYTFRVKTSLKDLAGKNLLEFTTKYAYDGSDDVLFEKPSETLHGESYVKNNVLFQGREYDPETGLYYFRARYYDPKLGLFLQPDPMGYQDSMNPYQAFNNNAVNFADPMGLQGYMERLYTRKALADAGLLGSEAQKQIDYELAYATTAIPRTLANPRVQGVLQASLGFVMSKMGIAITAASGGTMAWLGLPLWAKGVDNMTTGVRKTFSGKQVNTMTYELAKGTASAFTDNPKIQSFAATIFDALTDIVTTVGASNYILKTNSILRVSKNLSTAPNTAFFWSGRTNGVGGELFAREIAKNSGGTTLEGLLSQKGIRQPIWDPTNPKFIQEWSDLSKLYAQSASGEVRAVLGKTLKPGNVWETIELPALKANPSVTKITVIDPLTRTETVIFKR